MEKNKKNRLVVNNILVFVMILIQIFYAIYAFVDPSAFAVVRGTDLLNSADSDWVQIYASRTLFISSLMGYLLYIQNFTVIKWAALFAVVMPLTDALLAYQAQAPLSVVLKHSGTVAYLLIVFIVLHVYLNKSNAINRK